MTQIAMRKKLFPLSLFEKVILGNSILLVSEALAGLWVTSHSLETHHYLIDTSFIVVSTLLTLITNTFLLRTSFRPLYNLLTTIREISKGKTDERAHLLASDSEVGELAQAFNTMLDKLEAAQREQTMLIMQAQEEEQRRIALELHDEAGQNLTALLIHTELLSQHIQALPKNAISTQAQEQLTSGIARMNTLLQQTLEGVRVMAQQLRPSTLDDLGLASSFRWLVEDCRERLHLPVDLTIDGLTENREKNVLPTAYEVVLFRIAQESLTNIARHAQAQHVSILLRCNPHTITLLITDDGKGYDTTRQKMGLGVFGMRERAKSLGGKLTIHSEHGKGTTVEVHLPLLAKNLEEFLHAR